MNGGEAEVSTETDSNESRYENEETPVLDVHLPHPTHTWKGFWIHLATISIGC
jgi:hypothetical protein